MRRGRVRFRAVVAGAEMAQWVVDGDNSVAFARRGKGFVAVNRNDQEWRFRAATTLPPGTYCDVCGGDACESTVDVIGDDTNNGSSAEVVVPPMSAVAFH
eukprot:3409728-Pyramimonas_sp.AAC.2